MPGSVVTVTMDTVICKYSAMHTHMHRERDKEREASILWQTLISLLHGFNCAYCVYFMLNEICYYTYIHIVLEYMKKETDICCGNTPWLLIVYLNLWNWYVFVVLTVNCTLLVTLLVTSSFLVVKWDI